MNTTSPVAARRAALSREGHEIADRAEDDGRGFTAFERRRSADILSELDRLAPMKVCLVCCGALLLAGGGTRWCAGCGMTYFA